MEYFPADLFALQETQVGCFACPGSTPLTFEATLDRNDGLTVKFDRCLDLPKGTFYRRSPPVDGLFSDLLAVPGIVVASSGHDPYALYLARSSRLFAYDEVLNAVLKLVASRFPLQREAASESFDREAGEVPSFSIRPKDQVEGSRCETEQSKVVPEFAPNADETPPPPTSDDSEKTGSNLLETNALADRVELYAPRAKPQTQARRRSSRRK